jgi:hypothetical protein
MCGAIHAAAVAFEGDNGIRVGGRRRFAVPSIPI